MIEKASRTRRTCPDNLITASVSFHSNRCNLAYSGNRKKFQVDNEKIALILSDGTGYFG
jgi:hypothetical protein